MSSGSAVDHLAHGLTALEQGFELAGLDEHALHRRLLGAGVGGVGELVPGQDYAGSGVTEIERDLALLEQRVHWHDGGADTQRAVVAEAKCATLGSMMPTRSPGCTPFARSNPATRAAARSSSA